MSDRANWAKRCRELRALMPPREAGPPLNRGPALSDEVYEDAVSAVAHYAVNNKVMSLTVRELAVDLIWETDRRYRARLKEGCDE